MQVFRNAISLNRAALASRKPSVLRFVPRERWFRVRCPLRPRSCRQNAPGDRNPAPSHAGLLPPTRNMAAGARTAPGVKRRPGCGCAEDPSGRGAAAAERRDRHGGGPLPGLSRAPGAGDAAGLHAEPPRQNRRLPGQIGLGPRCGNPVSAPPPPPPRRLTAQHRPPRHVTSANARGLSGPPVAVATEASPASSGFAWRRLFRCGG